MKRQKRDPLSLMISLREKMEAARPAPLAAIPPDEIAAFLALRQILERSRLLPFLDKKVSTEHGERAICINEKLLAMLYPGVNPLTDPLPDIDSFIYVYEGITGHDVSTSGARGDLRQFFGEHGFRQLFLELHRACQIHQFCAGKTNPNRIVTEPITRKPISEARKESLAIHARAKVVFQQIAERIWAEMKGSDMELPRVLMDAHRFAQEMTAALEPLAQAGRQVRGLERKKKVIS